MAIDLRSDTVTKPSAAMRQAMASAEVGDDVYGDDPTVNSLEERVATMFGHEAGLFSPTGSLANQLLIRTLVKPGEELLTEERAHIVRAGVAEDIIERVGLRDVFAGFADHDSQLALVIHLLTLQMARQKYVIAWILDAADRFHEHNRVFRDRSVALGGMLPVVQANAKNSRRPERSQQPAGRNGCLGDLKIAENIPRDAESFSVGLKSRVFDGTGVCLVSYDFHAFDWSLTNRGNRWRRQGWVVVFIVLVLQRPLSQQRNCVRTGTLF